MADATQPHDIKRLGVIRVVCFQLRGNGSLPAPIRPITDAHLARLDSATTLTAVGLD
jgi:hypothetical protein